MRLVILSLIVHVRLLFLLGFPTAVPRQVGRLRRVRIHVGARVESAPRVRRAFERIQGQAGAAGFAARTAARRCQKDQNWEVEDFYISIQCERVEEFRKCVLCVVNVTIRLAIRSVIGINSIHYFTRLFRTKWRPFSITTQSRSAGVHAAHGALGVAL
jgi:hypothetical protein